MRPLTINLLCSPNPLYGFNSGCILGLATDLAYRLTLQGFYHQLLIDQKLTIDFIVLTIIIYINFVVTQPEPPCRGEWDTNP